MYKSPVSSKVRNIGRITSSWQLILVIFSLQVLIANCICKYSFKITGRWYSIVNEKIFSMQMISSLRSHFEKISFKYITYPKFIFLCGKAFSTPSEYTITNRGIIEAFIKNNYDDPFIVLSEKLWEDNFYSSIDLLTFEEFLAEVSDFILLFVESPGTFCELGAFTYADNLFSNKLIIILDEKYKDNKSFIINGPVLKAQNNGSKIIYAPVNSGALLSNNNLRATILECISNFKSKVSLCNKRIINKDQNFVILNSFIIEILELLRIVHPIKLSDLIKLYKIVKNFDSFTFVKQNRQNFNQEIKINYIFKLLKDVKLIKFDSDYISPLEHHKLQNLMFKYKGISEQKERNRLLCRKYKFGEKV